MADESRSDEVIVTEIVLKTDRAIKEAKDFRTAVDLTKAKMKELSASSKQSYDAIAEGMRKTAAANKQEVSEITRANKVITQSLKEVKNETEDVADNTGKSATSIKASWIAVGAAMAAVFKQIIQWFNEAIDAGLEFSQSMFRLVASTRALQRAGLDTTLAEVAKQVMQTREQFKFFSEQEIVDGIAQIQLLTRNFGFTTDQMKEMLEVATTLAVVQGKDVGTTARELALFYSSGYAEALQKAGFAVNKLSVVEEAHRLGYEKSYNALTEQERALAAHSIVLRQVADLTGEVGEYEDTLAGRYEVATASIDTSTTRIGEAFAFLKIEWAEFKAAFLQGVLEATNAWLQFDIEVTASAAGVVGAIKSVFDPTDARSMFDAYWDAYDEAYAARETQLGRADVPEDAPLGTPISPDTIVSDEVTDALDGLYDDIMDLIDERNKDLKDAEEDLQNDLADIDERGAEKREDIWQSYYDKLEDIEIKMGQKIEDAEIDLQQALQDLAIDTQRKLEDAARKYRDAELKAERDFQEKLRKLREGFLFDLEDALRERDARQVLRLIRRFNLEQSQLERNYAQEQEERKIAYQRELEDIRLQEQRKREELQRAFERKLEDIARQAAREREDAARDRDRALVELEEDLQRDRDKRRQEYEDEIAEIKQKFQEDFLDAITEAFKDFSDINTAEAQAMRNGIISALQDAVNQGKILSSEITGLVYQAISDINALVAASQTASDAANGINLYDNPELNAPTSSTLPTFAEGGVMVANKPTLAMFGEAGPEMATFTPLNNINSALNTSTSIGALGEGEQNLTIRILLEQGLKAEIMDNTLQAAAQIMEEVGY